MGCDDAWAAGFVDGEGYLHLQPTWPKRTLANWKPRIEVAQTDPRPLYKLQQLFGGVVLKLRIRENRRQAYRWDCTGPCVRGALERMIPYLIVKREQAQVLLDYCNNMKPRGGRLTVGDVQLRTTLVQKLLNLRKEI